MTEQIKEAPPYDKISKIVQTFFLPVYALLGSEGDGLSIPAALEALAKKYPEIDCSSEAYNYLNSEEGIVAAFTQLAQNQNPQLRALIDKISGIVQTKPEIMSLMAYNAFND